MIIQVIFGIVAVAITAALVVVFGSLIFSIFGLMLLAGVLAWMLGVPITVTHKKTLADGSVIKAVDKYRWFTKL